MLLAGDDVYKLFLCFVLIILERSLSEGFADKTERRFLNPFQQAQDIHFFNFHLKYSKLVAF